MLENIFETIVILIFICVLLYKSYDYIKYKLQLIKAKRNHDIDFNNLIKYNIYWNNYKCKKCKEIILEKSTSSNTGIMTDRFFINDIGLQKCKES